MERYNEYKDSGIFWQPQIPNNWIVKKLGYVLKKHNRPRPLGAELLVCTNKATVIKKGDSKMGMISENEEIYQGVAVGDLLIHGMDTWHGAIAISKYDGMCTPVVHVCTSEEDVAYISYYLRNMATQKVFKLISNGVRQNTSDFRGWDKVKEILCPIPPLPEQQAITSYLDTVTTKIDTAIAQQQKMIDLLNERKQIIINNAVTKGLNPNVKMKDSGVDWIGEIPEEWIFCKLKHLTSIISKGTTPSTIGRDIFETGEIRFLKAENIVDNKVQFSPEFYIDDITHGMMKRSNLQKDDILFVIAGATIGKVAIMPKEFIPANTNQAISFIRLIDKSYAPYIWNVLQSDLTKKYIWQNAVQSAQPNISMEDLGNIQIPLPSKAEQIDILHYIENCIKPIEDAISNAEKQIAFLQERKQIIINEVVTGKVKVC